jgi:hypothetical protein
LPIISGCINRYIESAGDIGHPCPTPWFVISHLELTVHSVSMQIIVSSYIPSIFPINDLTKWISRFRFVEKIYKSMPKYKNKYSI